MTAVLESVLISDGNVKREPRSVLAWCEQINKLPEEQRDAPTWHYAVLGETIVKDRKRKNARASEPLNYSRLLRSSAARQEELL